MVVGEGDERDIPIEPGQWRGGYMEGLTRLPKNCPVVPLGKLGATFYFLNTLGEVHELKDSARARGRSTPCSPAGRSTWSGPGRGSPRRRRRATRGR
jgi:hypothetical protein